MNILITGSSGLTGSEAVTYYDQLGHTIIGVDNNMRREFFGLPGDTLWNRQRFHENTRHFIPLDIDIRDRTLIFAFFQQERFDLIIHCAAQPSHDKAREIPLIDFEVNALGTLNLPEATRLFCPEAVFIFMSTNKVYGDAPNEVPLVELGTRYDYAHPADQSGIPETCRIDRCLHSLFGASKTSADVMSQEYRRYFGLKVGVFCGGCLTGPAHSGVELHGFLSYLLKVVLMVQSYRVFGYQGKQVRDNIHSYDVIQAFEAFRRNPRPGEVYNLGGGRENSVSILEAFDLVKAISGRSVNWRYEEQNRIGDHICYILDLRKLQSHYPEWQITRNLATIVEEMVVAQQSQLSAA